MKKIFLTFFLMSATAFGSESILLNKLMNNYGDGVEAFLVGKNVANNQPCYFKLHRAGTYNLMSADSSGLFRNEGVSTYDRKAIRLDGANNVEIFNQDVTPAFLGGTAEANIRRTSNILQVKIRNDANLECKFDLEKNKALPKVPQNCVTEEVKKTIAQCHFAENIGHADQQVTQGNLELQEVTVKLCVPGGIFEALSGYITQNGQINYTAKKTGLDSGWYNTNLEEFGIKKNDSKSFSYSTKRTEYSYDKKSKELTFKHEYNAGLFDTRRVAARFKCN